MYTTVFNLLVNPIQIPRTIGKTPKDTVSTSESIWIPNFFSVSLLLQALATVPSNISQTPAKIKHITAAGICPKNASTIPVTENASPI